MNRMIPALALFLSFQTTAQQLAEIPRDTSFTLFSTAVKVQAQYLFARVVVPALPKGVTVKENLVYASYGKRELHLNLFRPKGNTLYPGVILIHAGGWRSGDKSQSIPLAERIAAKGYVTVAVEYRLSPEALYPAAVHDLKAAVRWMRAHGVEYSIDTTKIAVLGCSAGGQLAALIGTTNGIERFEGTGGNAGHSSNVQAVVDIDGILDFTEPAESGKDTIPGKPSAGAAWFGATYKEKPQLWIDASPLVHAGKNTPPVVFINSSLDRFHAGRDEMIAKLTPYNIHTEVHTIPDTPHPFWFFHPWFKPTCDYAITFLNRVLKNP